MFNMLEGIRVIDLGRYISAPSCARHFADLGAEVIKVEKAGDGDPTRSCGPYANGQTIYYPIYNRNKKSITIDFRSDRGKEVLRRLIQKSDILVENFKTGTMANMGFSYEEVKKINPGIVMLSITGFGQTGPDASRPAYDDIVSLRSAFYSIGAGDKVVVPPRVSDVMAGWAAAYTCLAALNKRNRTGIGEHIDFCMMSCTAAIQSLELANYYANPNASDLMIDAPNGDFRTKDGMIRIICGPQPMFTKVRSVIDDPVLRDEKYLNVRTRIEDHVILENILAAWASQLTTDEADHILASHGITASRVATFDDVLNDAQLHSRNDLRMKPLPNGMDIPQLAYPAHFANSPEEPDQDSPALGSANYSILNGLLGFSESEVAVYSK